MFFCVLYCADCSDYCFFFLKTHLCWKWMVNIFLVLFQTRWLTTAISHPYQLSPPEDLFSPLRPIWRLSKIENINLQTLTLPVTVHTKARSTAAAAGKYLLTTIEFKQNRQYLVATITTTNKQKNHPINKEGKLWMNAPRVCCYRTDRVPPLSTVPIKVLSVAQTINIGVNNNGSNSVVCAPYWSYMAGHYWGGCKVNGPSCGHYKLYFIDKIVWIMVVQGDHKQQ